MIQSIIIHIINSDPVKALIKTFKLILLCEVVWLKDDDSNEIFMLEDHRAVSDVGCGLSGELPVTEEGELSQEWNELGAWVKR